MQWNSLYTTKTFFKWSESQLCKTDPGFDGCSLSSTFFVLETTQKKKPTTHTHKIHTHTPGRTDFLNLSSKKHIFDSLGLNKLVHTCAGPVWTWISLSAFHMFLREIASAQELVLFRHIPCSVPFPSSSEKKIKNQTIKFQHQTLLVSIPHGIFKNLSQNR